MDDNTQPAETEYTDLACESPEIANAVRQYLEQQIADIEDSERPSVSAYVEKATVRLKYFGCDDRREWDMQLMGYRDGISRVDTRTPAVCAIPAERHVEIDGAECERTGCRGTRLCLHYCGPHHREICLLAIAFGTPVSQEVAEPEELGNAETDTRHSQIIISGDRPLNAVDLVAHLRRQHEWSERTFGPGNRTAGVLDHIRKELIEIEAAPLDLSEWIDVAILALDGAWRAGYSPEEIAGALVAKQTRNEARAWPDWRTQPTDKAIEHERGATTPPQPSLAREIRSKGDYTDGLIAAVNECERVAKGYAARSLGEESTMIHSRNDYWQRAKGAEFCMERIRDLSISPESPAPLPPFVTCAKCGRDRDSSTLASLDTFVCRYCLSTEAAPELDASHPHVSRNPSIFGGTPIVNGVRFSVSDVLGYLATNKDIKDFYETWQLTEEMIRDAVGYAQDVYDVAVEQPSSSARVASPETLNAESVLVPETESCPDCDHCAVVANSDATTPGFFYDKCERHRSPVTEGRK